MSFFSRRKHNDNEQFMNDSEHNKKQRLSAGGAKKKAKRSKKKRKPNFKADSLESRILYSATWVDADTGDAQGGETAGNDAFTGTDGIDTADGSGGNDILSGLDGDDNLFGGTGNDTLDGGAGDDLLSGDSGSDTLISGGGNDTMSGGNGSDLFTFTGAQDGDVVTVDGGNGTDTIDLREFGKDAILSNDGSTMEVSLGGGESFTINYTEVENVLEAENTGPDAVNDSFTTNEDTAITTENVLGNDTDVDGDTLSIDSFTQPDHGTVASNGDGTFTYTPDANYNGADSFTYTISDGEGGTDTATIDLTVNSVNDGPEAVNDAYSVNEDATLTTGNVLNNDTDLDGDTLSVDSFTQPENGTVVYNDDGTFNYTPDANYNGADSFTYTVTDGNGGIDTATINLTVSSVDDAPATVLDTLTIAEDGSGTIDVLANDSEIEGQSLGIYAFTQPSHGSVESNGDGTFTYTADTNYNGTDTFTYTVSDGHGHMTTQSVDVVVTAVNDGPDSNGESFTTMEDTPVTIANLLANDTDIDGDTLAVDSFTQPTHGAVVDNGDGTLTYTPDPNYNGSDSFTYTISDGAGGTDTSTITLNVTSSNDGPTSGDDSYNNTEDTSLVTGDVLANDSDIDGDNLVMHDFTQPDHGTVDYNNDGTFTYVPDANYNGTDTFTYTIVDGHDAVSTATVTIENTAVNDGPNASADAFATIEDTPLTTGNVLANDSDVDGDTLSIDSFSQGTHGTVISNGDGTFVYTPAPGYTGSDSFTYTISDGNGGTDTATVYMNVQNSDGSGNSGPHAANDSYTTAEDTTLTTGNVLTNDIDAEGDTLSVASFTQPDHGTVTSNGDGTFEYTPDENYNGSDSFTYTTSDGNGGTSTATVNLNVTAVNDAAVTVDDSFTTAEDTQLITGNVLANDSDIEGDAIGIHHYSQPSHGSVSLNNDGTFTYKPVDNYNGADSFTYTITDANGNLTTGTVTIDITPVDDAPDADGENFSTIEDIPITTTNVLANDSHADGDSFEIQSFTQPANGTAVSNGDGTFTYTPNNNYNGSDSFTYTIVDEDGLTDTATINISISAVNDAVDVVDDVFTLDEDSTIRTSSVLANDVDAEGHTIAMLEYTQPEHGSISYNNDGTFSYTPDPDYNGTDSITYTVGDGHGTESTATVTFNVTPVNDIPDANSDWLTLQEDTTATSQNVLTNDTDIDGDTLTIHSYTEPLHGTVTYNNDGTFTYTPDENYNGSDKIEYTIVDAEGVQDTATLYFTVNAVNDDPDAFDDSFTTDEDTPITTGNLLANDNDLEGDTIAIDGYSQPTHGSLTYNNNGTFTYTPDDNYHGNDSFNYTIRDGNGGFDTASVSLTVNSINDSVIAADEAFTTAEDTPITTTNVFANDSDVEGDSLSIDSFTQPTHGAVVSHGDGTFTYTPDANYFGSDSFTYTVSDGNGGFDTATINLNVESVNDGPEAVYDSFTTDEDTAITTSNVLDNDTDLEGDTISVDSFTQPGNGVVESHGDGTFTYTPDENFHGNDSFTYTIVDEHGDTSTATVSFHVVSVNDGIVTANDSYELDEDTVFTTGNVLENDFDIDQDMLTISEFTQPEHGSVTYNDDGTFTYTPNGNYFGEDSMTYTVTDGYGETSTATISFTINDVAEYIPEVDESEIDDKPQENDNSWNDFSDLEVMDADDASGQNNQGYSVSFENEPEFQSDQDFSGPIIESDELEYAPIDLFTEIIESPTLEPFDIDLSGIEQRFDEVFEIQGGDIDDGDSLRTELSISPTDLTPDEGDNYQTQDTNRNSGISSLWGLLRSRDQKDEKKK